jgi:hypothetical protein
VRRLKRKYDAYKVIYLKPRKSGHLAREATGELSAQVQDKPWGEVQKWDTSNNQTRKKLAELTSTKGTNPVQTGNNRDLSSSS